MSNPPLKFCPFCGAKLVITGTKFCSECGAAFIVNPQNISSNNTNLNTSYSPEREIQQEEETIIKPKAYDLGVNLEETTAAIHKKMGWNALMRQWVPMKSGPNAEIDVLVTRGNRRMAIECKNYDTSRSVGISELMKFQKKLDETGITKGLFVTSSYFSRDAQEFAGSNDMGTWDRDELYEKFFLNALGRLVNPSLVQDPVLPVRMKFTDVTTLSIKNPEALNLQSIKLFYQPYILVKYRLRSERSDPTKKKHVVTDEGTVVVDALDGDVINPKTDVLSGIGELLKNEQERADSKSDKIVYKDLMSLNPVKETILSTSDYEVLVAKAEFNEESALQIMKDYVIKKYTKTVAYQKGKDEFDLYTMKIVPKVKEISHRGTMLVYVPKWDLVYDAVDRSYNRRFVASSGGVVEDPLAKCEKCRLLKKQAEVLCEVCGKPLCEKHSVFSDGVWMCQDHCNPPKKDGVFSKIAGLYKANPISESLKNIH
jgi:hypothetical protein